MRNFSVVTFGCQMNQHDSERIGEVLRGSGYTEVAEPAGADLIVLNTCSIREKAEQKLRSEVGRLGVLKESRPELTIVVAGCVAREEAEKLLTRLPQIDLILGPDNIPELPGLLSELELGGLPRVRTEFDTSAPYFLKAAPEFGKKAPSAFVTVMKGCNERCTYCIVPYTRGPERYRPAREIVDEIALLVSTGTREITLLGQTVNSYRDPARTLTPAPGANESDWEHTKKTHAVEDESEFAALLRLIAESVPGLARLRYTSPHPRHLTRSLIRAHQDLSMLVRHVHLPFQSGSDRVLKRMLRRYTTAEYRERVAALRESVPGLTLSTDVIVGFPGETREDFEGTLELVRDIEFAGLFGFKYSPRPHTPALKLEDDVSEAEKSARFQELFLLADGQRRLLLAALVGTTQEVLIEGQGSKGGALMGRSARNEIVHFAGPVTLIGSIVDVTVERAFKNSLFGQLTDPKLSEVVPPPIVKAKPAERRVLPLVRS